MIPEGTYICELLEVTGGQTRDRKPYVKLKLLTNRPLPTADGLGVERTNIIVYLIGSWGHIFAWRPQVGSNGWKVRVRHKEENGKMYLSTDLTGRVEKPAQAELDV